MRNNLLAAILFASSLISASVLAQTEPADSDVKAAVYDIGRAEQQLPSLSPSRPANITRLQRSLKIPEQRLNTSPNKSHASWVEAKQRLDKINATLASLMSRGSSVDSNAKCDV
jgi:hypothetical protein